MDKELQEVTSLPEVLSPEKDSHPTIPELPQPEYDHDSTEREIRAIDIKQNKYNFSLLAQAAQQARGVDSLIKCALAIDRLQERRRHLLNIPYGASSSSKKETIVYPID